MKKFMIMILAVVVMVMSLMPVGTALGNHKVEVSYVTQGNGWYTGVAITNLSASTVHNILVTFVHMDGTFDDTYDRVDLGEFAAYEMKVYSLDQLYNVDKDPAMPLPDTRLWLYIYQSVETQFGVAVFIVNDLAGIGGYGFQQFYSESY